MRSRGLLRCLVDGGVKRSECRMVEAHFARWMLDNVVKHVVSSCRERALLLSCLNSDAD